MNATLQYQLSPVDLQTVLAVKRGGTLANAGERLAMDASTVFRAVQRIERGLGCSLFERTRAGYLPNELGERLCERAEQLEATLELARSDLQQQPKQVAGQVRVSTTDTVLHGLVAPALAELSRMHPLLSFDLHTGNELTSLTRRDADIAVRATKRPPQHLVGKHVGPIEVALYAAKTRQARRAATIDAATTTWIAPDDALPEHPSVVWRKRQYPKLVPRYRVNSILTVCELVALGLGVGLLPMFLARRRADLLQVSDVIAECQTDLWLLTHPESRHLRRIAAVYGHLSRSLTLA